MFNIITHKKTYFIEKYINIYAQNDKFYMNFNQNASYSSMMQKVTDIIIKLDNKTIKLQGLFILIIKKDIKTIIEI